MAEKQGLKKILDVGCGTGRLVKYFNDKGYMASGCDINSEAIKFARKINKENSILKATATKLPFKDNSFDLVTSISVIEHLSEKQAKKFLSEVRRVLRDGGLIFLVTPNYSTPIRLVQGKRWFAHSDPTHIHYYTPNSLSKLLVDYEFKNIKMTFKTTYNPPYEWELPGLLGDMPKHIKSLMTFLLISTPLAFIRNSFWIAARK